jgi:ADP-dependent NAD(P)H-hydrate dehydratase / NAD(P)H-hydrate epimerase
VEFVKLVTGEEMAEIDRRTIAAGTPGAELMESAGRRVFDAIVEEWEGLEGLCPVVVCGRGNNGGDGFVIARLLHQAGAAVRVFLTTTREAVRGDAAHHLRLLEEAGGKVELLLEEGNLEVFREALEGADLVVDALLGTGLKGAPRPEAARIIECVMGSGRPVVAVDLPSGLEAGTGRVHGACMRAVLTVTFGLPKVGHLFFPGRTHCGILRLVDIGFSAEVIQTSPVDTYLLDEERMAALIPRRTDDAHKGTCGTVAVVAGSVGMTGAATLAADAALMAGAGRVTLGLPSSLNDIVEGKLTEVMTLPLAEVRKRRCLALRGLGEILELSGRSDCLALGPGVGRYRETVELVRRLVVQVERPLVLDADGLFALAGATDLLKERAAPIILTPHVGEFARLTRLATEDISSDPLGHAGRFAVEHGVVLVLKGGPTVVALADGRCLVNPTGNAGMATAGAGDVLTGLIAGLLGQGMSPEMAACLGVYLHGRAGDLARDQIGEWGMKAGDIGHLVPRAILDTYAAGAERR